MTRVAAPGQRHGDEAPTPRSPDDRERAFDRFWRGRRQPGSRPGSGLGLAIVKQLLMDDGGTVSLEESPSGGVTVRIVLRTPQAT
ncbi:sensor histidine kinase [Allorhizocola rhizosphaerae]|uniref:sensor histidine kinase n=1 Tax=Allorhizocola rhizosphaerae TaxID=1872709 RepID=UPI000E3E24C4|nr:ATP-binding protein [Allorhizocola rhizosphaerae]